MSAPEPSDIVRLRAALASIEDQSQWPEVDVERIFTALHGDMSPDERRAVVEELVKNPRAAAAWRLARELAPEAAPMVTATHTVADRGRVWMWTLAAAAALMIAVVGWQYRPGGLDDGPIYRSTETRSIESLAAPGERLSRASPVLRWTAIEGAKYRVRVLTPGLDVLAEADDLAVAEYRVSDEVLGRLTPGAQMLWQVEATVPGRPSVVSQTFSLQLE